MSIVSPERLPPPRYCQICGHHLVERYVEAERRRRLQCENCGFVHYLNPRVVVSIIVEHRRRVLLQQRAYDPRAGFWTFPGGFLEVGELPEEGARRETLEEVGLDVTPARLQGVYARPDVGITLIVYNGTSDSDDARVSDPESLQVRWFAVDEIPWAELAFTTTEHALRDWVRDRAQQDAK
jgi:ADP-ribose pyrophosphatase YjhB (NUDIX family)